MAEKPRTPSEIFGTQVREIRERRHPKMTQEGLAKRLREEFGVDMSRTTITRIESGSAKRITLDDAFVIAAALGVAPIYLFFPHRTEDPVQITPNDVLDPDSARDWVAGRWALRKEDDRFYHDEIATSEWEAQKTLSDPEVFEIVKLLSATTERLNRKKLKERSEKRGAHS